MSRIEGLPNSEILLIYEAKNCNPNGDPDAENRPRMDYKTGRNLVSDVRLKRFFRDYIVERFGENHVYVTKIGGQSVRADTRIEKLLGRLDVGRNHEVLKREVLKRCIDARLFGATIPIGRGERRGGREEGREERGAAISIIGPVQFTWGFSLHKVELIESSTITSVFAGREEAERYGTIGKDWRVYYSLIGFYGVVSGRRAKATGMSDMDLKVFDNLLWKALQVQPTTRSKIGEAPHLYLRLEYMNADTILGDLRKYMDVKPKTDAVRGLEDLEVSFGRLIDLIKRNDRLISKAYVMVSDEFSPLASQLLENIPKEKLHMLPHKLEDSVIEAVIKGT